MKSIRFSVYPKNFFKYWKSPGLLSVRKSGNHDMQFKHVLRKIWHKTLVDYFGGGGGVIVKSEKKNPSIVKYFSFLGQSQVVPPVNRRWIREVKHQRSCHGWTFWQMFKKWSWIGAQGSFFTTQTGIPRRLRINGGQVDFGRLSTLGELAKLRYVMFCILSPILNGTIW